RPPRLTILSSLSPPPHPRPTLFPYTTLFRSVAGLGREHDVAGVRAQAAQRDDHRFLAARRHHDRLGGNADVLVDLQHPGDHPPRSEEHTSELQSRFDLVCRLLLEKKKKIKEL